MAAAVESKGVMLCDRPPAAAAAESSAPNSEKPFIPSSAVGQLEPVGLKPSRKQMPMRARQAGTLDRHLAEIKAMQADARAAAAALEERQAEEEASAKRLADFSATLRTKILSGEDVSATWAPAAAAKTLAATKLSHELERAQRNNETDTLGEPSPSQPQQAGNAAADEGGEPYEVFPKTVALPPVAAVAAKQEMGAFLDDVFEGIDPSIAGPPPKQQPPPQQQPPPGEQPAPQRPDEGAAATTAEPAESGTGAQVAAFDGNGELVAASDSAVAAAATKAVDEPQAGEDDERKKKKKKKQKGLPAWALTEEAAEVKEEEEVADLLEFAEGLDWEKYIEGLDDSELADAMEAIAQAQDEDGAAKDGADGKAWTKGFVRAMNRLAMRDIAAAGSAGGKGADGCSMAGQSEGGASTVSRITASAAAKSVGAAERRAALADKGKRGAGDWDGGSAAAADAGKMAAAADAAAAARDVMFENPELARIHTPASVGQLLKAAQEARAAELPPIDE